MAMAMAIAESGEDENRVSCLQGGEMEVAGSRVCLSEISESLNVNVNLVLESDC